MIELKLTDRNIIENIKSNFFAHYKKHTQHTRNTLFDISEELSKNDFELHKQYIKGGHNPNEIAKIIRNDEIEKLQEISSQTNFNINQRIEPSLYERCSFINKPNVTLIDYAAFFSSVKCFKYLLMNGANVINTGKYAVAGGNEEIIHLCEQNHSVFEDVYETAIQFHRNDIFRYFYGNILDKLTIDQLNTCDPQGIVDDAYFPSDDINNNLGYLCIQNGNYEILIFLLENSIRVNEFLINNTAKFGNLFLIKHFLENNQISKNSLIYAMESKNIELIKYFIKQKGIDINAKDIYLFYLKFILIIIYFKIIFRNYLNYVELYL